MDCKPEPAARTLLRMECIAVQGICRAVVLAGIDVVFIPLNTVAFVLERVFGAWTSPDINRFVECLRRFAVSPIWLVQAILHSLWLPFHTLYGNLKYIGPVVKCVWVNRWQAAAPKKPNGAPLKPHSIDFEYYLTARIFDGLFREYGI